MEDSFPFSKRVAFDTLTSTGKPMPLLYERDMHKVSHGLLWDIKSSGRKDSVDLQSLDSSLPPPVITKCPAIGLLGILSYVMSTREQAGS